MAAVVLLLALGTFVYSQRPVVETDGKFADESLLMENDAWTLRFSKALSKNTVTRENIFVEDSDGRRVDVSLTLSDDRKSLEVAPPSEGYPSGQQRFILHISPKVKTTWGLSYDGDTEIPFTVTSQLPSIQSKQALTNYFKKIIKENKKHAGLFRTMELETKTAEDSAEMESSQSTSEFSGTNNQVEGVDEGDVVKTDGRYIYQLTDRKLVITEVKPLKVLSTLPFKENFNPHHLFVEKNKLLVIGTSWSPPFYEKGDRQSSPPIMPVEGMTVAMMYDISDREKPALLREVELEGGYVASRKVDSHIYLISNMSPNYWMLEQDDEVDLRPRVKDSLNGEGMKRIPAEDIQYFPQSQSLQYTLITSLDMEEPEASITVQTYLGGGQNVYMSEENLYVAVEKYRENGDWASADTGIHKFAVRDGDIRYTASGSVDGRVLNQFSMDEHEGNFRIATTEGEAWDDDHPSSNSLYILDSSMRKVGEVEKLARGERIYSVRFMGDKAYIVTFKQVDPLFVIDTSDPANPKVEGELKIPGFSTYLHPIDEHHLIGFGYDTKVISEKMSDEPRVSRNGMKMSLFDITDFENPKEMDTEIIGGSGTHSTLLEDHKALLHMRERNLYGFPVTVYDEKEKSSRELDFDYQGALLYEITPEKGIVRRAKFTEKELYEEWENQIQRLIYIDEELYTVSHSEITAYSLNDFEKVGFIGID